MPTYASRSLWTSAAAGLDSSTIAWISNVFAQSSTVVSDAQAAIVNTLIVGLKADSVWDKLDELFLFAIENQDEALNGIVRGIIATAVNTPTFTPNRGFAGDGATSYVDTGFHAAIEGINYTQNSAHFSAWDTEPTYSDNALERILGAGGASGRAQLFPRNATITISNINDNTEQDQIPRVSDGTPHMLVSRDTSSSVSMYFDGAASSDSPFASNTTSIADYDAFFVGGFDNGGSLTGGSTDQIAMVSFGGALTATDAANLYTRLRTYMTSMGVP